MASRADKLKERLGSHIAESMGAGRAEVMPEPASHPSPASGVASKHDGVKPLREARTIRLENLARDPSQPRQIFDAESLDRLARSLIARGQLQPIRVRWEQNQGKYLIVAGERRWRAAQIAGLETLHAVVVEKELTPTELLQEQLVENCLREDLQPVEQARAFRALMDSNGWSARKVADELNLANSTVVKALSLLDLSPEVQSHVDAGELSPAAAYEVSKLETPEAQAEVAEAIVKNKLTRDQAAEAVREKSGKPKKPAAPRPKPSPAPVESAASADEEVVPLPQYDPPIAVAIKAEPFEVIAADGSRIVIGPPASASREGMVTALNDAITILQHRYFQSA